MAYVSFRGSYGVNEELRRAFDDAVQAAVFNHPYISKRFDLLERSRIEPVLREQNFVISQGIDPRNAPELGKLLGARYILLGELVSFDAKENRSQVLLANVSTLSLHVRVALTLVETESGRVLARVSADRTETVLTQTGVGVSWTLQLSTPVTLPEKAVTDALNKICYEALNELFRRLAA
ncbi:MULTISPECIES: CsgG/HfaB family protein [unclassified Meiothermus]|uniref:CsgG/HfaB family protein n=1 Tax=Meiothermus sp. Pnk-1 TaxID=873128 RepID=UPI002104E980|nr:MULTISPECIES: CsgG/HfaB family protein [unclassified Meiothermus]